MKIQYFKCSKCGQIIAMIKKTGVPVICCGQPMDEIKAGVVDAALEKHVPVYSVEGNILRVRIGEIDHPMTEEHYIEWISVETKEGNQRKDLKPGDDPVADFSLTENDEVISVYAYCNLHGLWKK